MIVAITASRAATPINAGSTTLKEAKGSPLQNQEIIGVHDALQEARQAAKERAEQQARKNHQGQVSVFAPEKQSEQQAGEADHHQAFDREEQPWIDRHGSCAAKSGHKRGLQEQEQCVEAHDGRCQDAVAGQGLEQHRRQGDGIGPR